jgi:hypothetical protein
VKILFFIKIKMITIIKKNNSSFIRNSNILKIIRSNHKNNLKLEKRILNLISNYLHNASTVLHNLTMLYNLKEFAIYLLHFQIMINQ